MSITPEQIEQKRLQAIERREALQKSASNSSHFTKSFAYNSPVKQNNGILQSNSSIRTSTLINSINNSSKNNVCGGPFPKSPVTSRPSVQPYNRNNLNSNVPEKNPSVFFNENAVIKGSIILISENRFQVEHDKFHQPLIELLKTIPSRHYDTKLKLWDFDIKDYDLLYSKVIQLRPQVVISPLPSFVLKCVKSCKPNCKIDFSRIDSELLNTLMPFQKDGVRFGIEKNGRCLIADDMGLGKTFQALGIASYYKEDWPLLIVTTSTMRNTWEEKIQDYLPSVPLMYVKYMESGKDYITDCKVLIVSHDLMSRALDKLIEKKFGVLIIDESHILKNFKTKCAKAAEPLAQLARRVILLSGTPALSRPSELFTQLKMIDKYFFPDFKEYSKRYCNGHMSRFGWNSDGQSNLGELEIILNKKFMIRRTKDQVLTLLPSKTRHIIRLNTELLGLSDTDQKCLNVLQDNFKQRTKDKHAALLTFFSETANLKIKAVCSYIKKVILEDTKFIIFAHHQVMLNALCELMELSNVKYIRIDGKTTPDQRKFFVDRFQLQDKYKCAVLSITAANAGITLTAAKIVIFSELHWNPSILSQAESRAHRIGQEDQVQVRYLLAEGTADDHIWPMIESKQDVLNEVGLSKDCFKDTTVTDQDISDVKLPKSNTLENYFSVTNEQKINENIIKEEIDEAVLREFENDEFDEFNDDLCDEDLINMDI